MEINLPIYTDSGNIIWNHPISECTTVQLHQNFLYSFSLYLHIPRPTISMELTLTLHERRISHDSHNLFRIGSESGDESTCYGYGSRYPSLWLMPITNHLNLEISQQQNCLYGSTQNHIIELEQPYSIIIEFNDTWMFMSVDDEVVVNEQRASPTIEGIYGQQLKVWISTDRASGSADDLNVTLSNITIISWDPTNSSFTQSIALLSRPDKVKP